MKQWFQDQRLMSFLILGASLLIAFVLILMKGDVKKAQPEAKPVLVQLLQVQPVDKRMTFEAYGTVQANRELSLHPEVSGMVVEQSENLVVGGLTQKGEILLKIDPRDYQTAVEDAKAQVEKAKFELQQEKGRQIVAEREWELLDPTITASEIGKELALRIPHVREKEAALTAAKSRLEKAEIDLERTVIRSPFNAVVIDETVEPGEIVQEQTTIATLVATDEFRVQVSLPYDQLHWIELPKNGEKGANVKVIQTLGGGREIERSAYILRLLGNLDPQSRMARLIVGISDPLGIGEKSGKRPLLIGTYVRVEIDGPMMKGIFVIPREAVRNNDEVWVANDQGELEIRKIEILFKEQDQVFVQEGLKAGDAVVLSPIPIPIPGMKLQPAKEAGK